MKKYIVPMIVLSAGLSSHAASLNGFDMTAYGFIKASGMYADKGLASFNNINMSAPTHAVAQTRAQDNTSRFSIQTQQSRIGTALSKDKVTAKLEFDFVDFNKSSPTTQMNPRVRLANVTYAWDNNRIMIGQDWDLFSPVTSYTYDYVGLFFMAGNIGFMRQQIQYLKNVGDWEFGAALGMAGNNPGVSDADLELSKSPTYSARIGRTIKDGRMGVSAIYSSLQYETSNGVRRDAYGYNAFYEQKIGKLFLKSEAYYGQNLNNIGSLGIGKGINVADAKEFGGTFTGQYVIGEKETIFGGVGTAIIDNPSELTPFLIGTNGAISNPGVKSNFLSRLGYEYKVTPDLSWLTELSRYETNSKISGNKYQLNVAHSLESGVQLRF